MKPSNEPSYSEKLKAKIVRLRGDVYRLREERNSIGAKAASLADRAAEVEKELADITAKWNKENLRELAVNYLRWAIHSLYDDNQAEERKAIERACYIVEEYQVRDYDWEPDGTLKQEEAAERSKLGQDIARKDKQLWVLCYKLADLAQKAKQRGTITYNDFGFLTSDGWEAWAEQQTRKITNEPPT